MPLNRFAAIPLDADNVRLAICAAGVLAMTASWAVLGTNLAHYGIRAGIFAASAIGPGPLLAMTAAGALAAAAGVKRLRTR